MSRPTRLNARIGAVDLASSQSASLDAAFRPATSRQRQPTPTLITDWQSGHGWSNIATGAAWNLNYTSDAYTGSQCVQATTNINAADGALQKSGFTAIDLTNKVFVLYVKVVSGIQYLSKLSLVVGDTAFANNYNLSVYSTAGSQQVIREGEWFPLRFTLADNLATTGTPTISAVTALRILIADNGAGSTVLRFGKLGYYTPDATTYPNGAVTLWFDDSFASQRTICAPYMAKYGFAGSAALICDAVGSSGTKLTMTQAHDLADQYGWEVNPHASTQARHDAGLTVLTPDQLVDEFNTIKRWFGANGFGANDHFAYPLGYNNATTDAVVGKYFSSARTTVAAPLETMLPGVRLRTRCYSTGNTTTFTELKAVIDRGFRPGVWTQFYFHDIAATASTSVQVSTSVFQQFVDYLSTKGCAVVSAGDAWNAGLR